MAVNDDRLRSGYVLSPRSVSAWLQDKPPLWSKLWNHLLAEARFRDRGRLSRGQLFTTIDDLREALSWSVGFRLERPGRPEIRSAYKGIAERSLISITKVTGGMVITIENYNEIQNPESYEAHNEEHSEAHNEAHNRNRRKEKEGEGKEKTPLPPGSSPGRPEAAIQSGKNWGRQCDLTLALRLRERLGELDPSAAKKMNLAATANCFRLMRDQDQRSVAEIHKVFEWATHDDFWKANILSADSLRKQFSRLKLLAEQANPFGDMPSLEDLRRQIEAEGAEEPTDWAGDFPTDPHWLEEEAGGHRK